MENVLIPDDSCVPSAIITEFLLARSQDFIELANLRVRVSLLELLHGSVWHFAVVLIQVRGGRPLKEINTLRAAVISPMMPIGNRCKAFLR
jgi:hypothetical protein